ncbi:hypothetical protein FRC17_001310 [Serendipita sp. 399]|nr:hypothetical protein FRC17_001310 [Serendipita sp. 399]
MKLFRTGKTKPITPRSPGMMEGGNGPGNGNTSSNNSGGIAGVLSRAGGGDLSSRIEPYTFPSSSPPPAPPQHHHQQSRSGPNTLQQTSSLDTLGAVAGAGVVGAASAGARADPMISNRRNSLRARPSEDERWVMVDDSNGESRSSSIASLIPTGAAAPYNSPGFTQTTSVVAPTNPSNTLPTSPIQRPQQPPIGVKRPPNPSTPRPEQQQQQLAPQSQPQLQPQSQPQPQPQALSNGQSHLVDPDNGSIHSQHKEGWARGFFGGTGSGKEREKEANVELVRMIVQTSSRKFLENLEDVINAETTSPVVRERLLDVLASAAYKFGKMPGKEGFATTWRRVRPSWKPAEGLPFDSLEGLFDSAFPRRPVPAQSAGQFVEQPRERREDRDRGKKDRDRDKHSQQQRQLEALQGHGYRTHATPQVPSRRDRGIIPPDEDIRRLFQECEVAKTNAQLLSNCLTYANTATFATDPVIQEFFGKCRASQELIVAQIPWASAGAERAAASRRQAKDSGSEGAAPGKLIKKNAGGDPAIANLTKEEKLLAALLVANQELVEVFGIYEQLEKMAISEREDKEIAQRSLTEQKLDRTNIRVTLPDGSFLTEPPSSQGASSSSRSPSPAVTPGPTPPVSRTAPGTPVLSGVPGQGINNKAPGSRDLPLPPPHQSVDHITNPGMTTPGMQTPSAYHQHPSQAPPLTPLHLPPQTLAHQVPSPMQLHPQHDFGSLPQPVPPLSQPMRSPHPPPASQTQPYHAHHASNHSVSGYSNSNLNLPPIGPHGPRSQPSTRSRTPSPDRSGTYSTSSTPPTVGTPTNGSDYGPPAHPPQPHSNHVAAAAGARSLGTRYDSASRGRAESPVPASLGVTPPPGLAGVATGAGVAMHNTAGIRIDMDAARRYESSDEEELLTPIKPSAKALGKRRAEADTPVDDEELGRREQAELEEAYMRSTVPPGTDIELPSRQIQYVYDAAAERASQLDEYEREQELLRRQRASMQRGNGGGSAAAAAS